MKRRKTSQEKKIVRKFKIKNSNCTLEVIHGIIPFVQGEGKCPRKKAHNN